MKENNTCIPFKYENILRKHISLIWDQICVGLYLNDEQNEYTKKYLVVHYLVGWWGKVLNKEFFDVELMMKYK